MGIIWSRGAASPVAVFIALATHHERLTKEQIHMVDRYLPDFRIHEPSTEQHRQIAANHWDAIFREKRTSMSRVSQSYSTKNLSQAYSAKNLNAASDHRARDSSFNNTPSTTQTGSKIGALFDAFYAHLDQHSPELKPLFRSSLHVKGKVLVHISAGMRSILASDHVADKMMALTKTHMRFGVRLEYFNPLGKALLYAMAAVSEEAWTPEVADAWRRLFAHCSAMLMVTQSKMGDRSHTQHDHSVARSQS